MAEAQRFPGDYDGIISGDPDLYATQIQAAQLFIGQAAHKDDASYIPPAKYAALHSGRARGLRRARRGQRRRDRRSHAVPLRSAVHRLQGRGRAFLSDGGASGNGAGRPTPGAHAGKAALWGLEPGSESGWASLSGPQPLGIAVDTYQYLVFNDPKWDYHTLDAGEGCGRRGQGHRTR